MLTLRMPQERKLIVFHIRSVQSGAVVAVPSTPSGPKRSSASSQLSTPLHTPPLPEGHCLIGSCGPLPRGSPSQRLVDAEVPKTSPPALAWDLPRSWSATPRANFLYCPPPLPRSWSRPLTNKPHGMWLEEGDSALGVGVRSLTGRWPRGPRLCGGAPIAPGVLCNRSEPPDERGWNLH